MLKIKDNVDLKELENYGFVEDEWYDDKFYKYDLKDGRTYITIGIDDREIGIPTSLYGDIPAVYINNLDIIYTLIQTGLVEKV
mgnify:CR=1 FL=1